VFKGGGFFSVLVMMLIWGGGCRTTTELTTTFSLGIARMLGLERMESAIEVIVRGVSANLWLQPMGFSRSIRAKCAR
jgi:hypothetical protein